MKNKWVILIGISLIITGCFKKEEEVVENNNIPVEHKAVISDEVRDLFEKYPDLEMYIKDASIDIPVKERMIPQGILVNDEYILVTAYDEEGVNDSIIYVLNRMGSLVNIVDLNNKSHVGGIAYDEINNLIWVPGENGKLNAYDYNELLNKEEVNFKYSLDYVSDGLVDYQDSRKNLIAYLAIDNKYLYIGNFKIYSNCLVKKYEIKNEGSELVYLEQFELPSKTQGIEWYHKNDMDYLIISRSYGRDKDSLIDIYEYNDNLGKMINSLKVPPLLEQVVVKNGELYLMFESKALKYSNCLDKVNKVITLDMEKMI